MGDYKNNTKFFLGAGRDKQLILYYDMIRERIVAVNGFIKELITKELSPSSLNTNGNI